MMESNRLQDYVYAIAPSPDFAQDGICFVARESGLCRYDTHSRTWHDAYATLQLPDSLVTPAVALSPAFASDGTVYAGTNGGVLRSEDGGESWVLGNMPMPPPVITALVLSPDFARDGVVFAGTIEDGVLRSPDRGAQWHRWNFGLLDPRILAVAVSPRFADDVMLLTGTESGLFRSTNGGRSWRQLGLPADLAPVLSLALSTAHPAGTTPLHPAKGVRGRPCREQGTTAIFVGTELSGLHMSRDDGNQWTRLAEDVLPDAVNTILVSPCFPATPHLLAATDERIVVSRDGGDTWVVNPLAPRERRAGLSRTGDYHNYDLPRGESVCAVAAPLGLEPGAPLLVGMSDGQVLQLLLTKS